MIRRFVPFFAMESFRDRLIDLPIVLVDEPFANFAITRESSRRETADDNLQVLTFSRQQGSTVIPHADGFFTRVWAEYRGSRGHTQRALLAAGQSPGALHHC